jgi:hypothetical protein
MREKDVQLRYSGADFSAIGLEMIPLLDLIRTHLLEWEAQTIRNPKRGSMITYTVSNPHLRNGVLWADLKIEERQSFVPEDTKPK